MSIIYCYIETTLLGTVLRTDKPLYFLKSQGGNQMLLYSISLQVHEEVLHQEIRQLKSDLKKAKSFHSPEMQHYSQLEDKIVVMENRYSRREQELQTIIQNLRVNADVEKDAVLRKWRELLRKKTEETERFRVELEAILSVLEELRQQGVVIPMSKIKHSQYS